MTARMTVTFEGDVEVVLPNAIHVPTMQDQLPPPLSYNLEDAALATGFSHTQLRRYIAARQLTTRKSGTTNIILRDDLLDFLRNLPVARTEG